MTLTALAQQNQPKACLPEWPAAAYLEQLPTKHDGFGVFCEVHGFSKDPIKLPVFVFEEPDGGRWEPWQPETQRL